MNPSAPGIPSPRRAATEASFVEDNMAASFPAHSAGAGAAARQWRGVEAIQAARAELEALRRELADNEQRRQAYEELYKQGQQQVVYLRQQNAACLAAVAMLRRTESAHPPPAAARRGASDQSAT